MSAFEDLGTGVAVVLMILVLIVAALPILYADWRRAPEVATLVLVVAVGSGFFAAYTAPLLRDFLFVTGWIGASILSALSRILGILVERRTASDPDAK
ncbi:hypothetical protein C8N35_10291 [Breoghania corrubedonensis]|uniref:Uncharacterized protein n=1 Tax=Breoghania corrubedonensis TaxID=665038 RepID=A0A2T5VCB0_9HYPH|nr:hypothetical protein [Breoghania corrubedonensis]PTW61382.1 hypothetical protein C8N35_10291 [Breoghania corrubedonensis]